MEGLMLCIFYWWHLKAIHLLANMSLGSACCMKTDIERKKTSNYRLDLRTSDMGLLPDTWNCGLRMRRECRERFPRHQLQRKPLVSNPGMHHGTCVTHVPWCMSGSLTCGGRGKRSRHSRRMRNPQFYVSGKRPIKTIRFAQNIKPLFHNPSVYIIVDESLSF